MRSKLFFEASIKSALKLRRAAVLGAQHEETQNLQIVFLTDLTHGKGVSRDLDILRLSIFKNALCIQ